MDTGATQMGQFGAFNGDLLAPARAMILLESDQEAVRKCLTDAATLLESEAPRPGMSSAQTFPPGGLSRWQAKRALAHIEANLGSKMEIRELAQLIGLSMSCFSRAFTRSFGLPPMKYVATRRVERAKVMMTSTGEQLSEIALVCGFTDQPHLTRCFHRIVGTSPGRWRRINL